MSVSKDLISKLHKFKRIGYFSVFLGSWEITLWYEGEFCSAVDGVTIFHGPFW